MSSRRPIDVIVPVYDGLEAVQRCLASVRSASNETPMELVVINDASPNPAVGKWLTPLAERGAITLLENEHNLGFVATVNRGMRLHPDRDVVLLNSDTEVAGNWLDRLRAQAEAAEMIGTVTPFSNNAEICSFPRICCANPLAMNLPTDTIDAALAAALPGRSVDLPTAIGFCMLIRRACLDEVGDFDVETFGQGYGEENDFCLRASQQGWRHVLAADCFVAHVGGVSFQARKQERVAHAMAVLDRRYPSYHGDVAAWIVADPPYALRCKGYLELIRRDNRPVVLAVTHDLGGGTQRHIAELAELLAEQANMLLLRPFSGTELRLTLGVDEHLPGLNFDVELAGDREALFRLLRHVGVNRVHIHHILGTEEFLPVLLEMLAVPYDLTLHDYFLVDGNPTLTDESGMFHRDRSQRGEGCNSARVIRDAPALKRWHASQQKLLHGAQRVFVPSRAALALHQEAFAVEHGVVRGHSDLLDGEALPVSPPADDLHERRMRVLVLGALGIEKGALLLERTASRAAQLKLPMSFTLLGYSFRPLNRVAVHGPYADADLEALIRAEAPDLIWFPCRWPETYSYTLSAALKAGVPVLAPDLGSFPERVEGRPLTWLHPFDLSPEDAALKIEAVRQQLLATAGNDPLAWNLPACGDFDYRVEYLRGIRRRVSEEEFSIDHISAQLAGSIDRAHRIRLLRTLHWLKQQPAVSWLVRMIPFRWQRAVKRRISRRPIHELFER
ncbi:MAG: glycosyltransferase [Pseudomonadota bacterium]